MLRHKLMMGQKSRPTLPPGDCGEAVFVTEVLPVKSDPPGVRVAAERDRFDHLGVDINRDCNPELTWMVTILRVARKPRMGGVNAGSQNGVEARELAGDQCQSR